MAISGVGQSYYQNNVATTKSTKSVNSTGETGNTKELSEQCDNNEKHQKCKQHRRIRIRKKQAERRNCRKRKKWNYSKRNSMKTFLKLQTTGQ